MLIQADARMIPLRDACVQAVITSPPYFGLRDYGIAGQIGLEPTPDAYVAQIVAVFREVRRVLTDDGVCWLNLGDSYWSTSGNTKTGLARLSERLDGSPRHGENWATVQGVMHGFERPKNPYGNKQLMGIPWRVAFALQADGWYLRSDIIWHKANPMPESVTDRPTKAHEYLFLLTKSERYYYDADTIREAHTSPTIARNRHQNGGGSAESLSGDCRQDFGRMEYNVLGRNKRSVWTVATMPYAGAHFATMPEALVEPCILAGSRMGDIVFDPFIGSGTVGAVAERLGRRWVGTDLNPAYHQLAKRRTAQCGLAFIA